MSFSTSPGPGPQWSDDHDHIAERVQPPLYAVDDPASVVRRAVLSGGHLAVIVDFDDTLLLDNSTKAYLRSVRPRWLQPLLLKPLGVVFRLTPWGRRRRFLYRDWLAVLLVTVLVPWTLPRWRRRAQQHGETHRNAELLDALQGAGSLQVVTFGFAPVVRPLLQGVAPEAELLVSCDLWRGHRLRAEGKRAAVLRAIGPEALAHSLVVTDSKDDDDLLGACRTPLLLLWR